jgi:hypothetical protein
LSLLLDATGYRGMLRESRAETTEGRLENPLELVQLAGGFTRRASSLIMPPRRRPTKRNRSCS